MTTKPFDRLEVGKTYLNREDSVVRITEQDRGEPIYPFRGMVVSGEMPGDDDYTSEGTFFHPDHPDYDRCKWDLVSEVVSESETPGTRYPTKGGLEAVVLFDQAPDKDYPLLGYVVTSAGHCDPTHWSAAGEWVKGKPGSPRDLVMAPPAPPSLRDAAEALLDRYLTLANSGDCGNWDPEQESEVIALRAALAAEQP